ncbi:hypothetical protein [Streptomyces sp. NPDC087859]|uniref:hypothetical protein n=1 Tax=Streptomyces sp. NPDC087859 TaxID=3365812 RepID=UPI0037F36E15
MYALPLYAEDRAALGDQETFYSGGASRWTPPPEGVPVATLLSNGALQEHLRSVRTGS